MGGIQEAFPAGRHKKGAGLLSGETSSGRKRSREKKNTEPSPTSSHPSLSLSLSSPTQLPSLSLSLSLSPWPLHCSAVPAGFQGAANGLRLIYMQLGWDTCRPSSPSNGAAQESRLSTTGDGRAHAIMAALHRGSAQGALGRLERHKQRSIQAVGRIKIRDGCVIGEVTRLKPCLQNEG